MVDAGGTGGLEAWIEDEYGEGSDDLGQVAEKRNEYQFRGK